MEATSDRAAVPLDRAHSVGAEVETSTEEKVSWAPQAQGQHVYQPAERRHHHRMPHGGLSVPYQVLPGRCRSAKV